MLALDDAGLIRIEPSLQHAHTSVAQELFFLLAQSEVVRPTTSSSLFPALDLRPKVVEAIVDRLLALRASHLRALA